MAKIKSFFKRLFCRHAYQTKRWHWFHGATAMEPRRMEVELYCCLCGKTMFIYPERGSTSEEFFMNLKEYQE